MKLFDNEHDVAYEPLTAREYWGTILVTLLGVIALMVVVNLLVG